MGKNDFDIDFDFNEEYGFDPKAFLGTEEYDENIDLDAFSDEELGLTSPKKASAPAADEEFDLDEELDPDDFLNLSSQEETAAPEEAPEDSWSDEAADFAEEDEDEEEEPEPSLEDESEETDMTEDMEYDEELEMEETEEYDEEVFEEEDEAEDSEEEDMPKKKRQKKARKPVQLPKITLPKIKLPKLKMPNLFTKFFDLYFAPVLYKELREEPQDPEAPRRRRRKTKAQIFKEVYLPPIIVCVSLILVITFLIGSVSNAIQLKQIQKEKEQMQISESLSAAAQAEQETQRILAQAEKLAAEYNYEDAITLLDSMGDLTQYQELQAKRAEYINTMSSMIEYKDPTMIPNLSFHVLIHDMAKALKSEQYGGSYNKNFVTTGEFTKILENLYRNGYVLVDFESFVGAKTDINGNAQFEAVPIYLPADKKPVMITETMVNYFAYMIDPNNDGTIDHTGFASKLVLDGNGNIKAEYVDANGQTNVGNYDLVPILEDFIQSHPDFSYRGARAILAVTGHEGVFGYRINSAVVASKGNDYWENEVAGAKAITNALRDKGYTIACYSYKHGAYAGRSVAQISADLQSWTPQITSVIGNVATFVFAKPSNISDYNGNAFQTMYQSGFRYFISNADTPMTQVNPTYVRQNRLMVTGETMQHYTSRFTGLVDCAAILEVIVRGDIAKSK